MRLMLDMSRQPGLPPFFYINSFKIVLPLRYSKDYERKLHKLYSRHLTVGNDCRRLEW